MKENPKEHFYEMLAGVQAKLNRLPTESIVRAHFSSSRIETISKKIERSNIKDLEWGDWQPFFLFLNENDDRAISSLDDDLRLIESRSHDGDRSYLRFLGDEQEGANPWLSGLFEVYVKAALLRSTSLLVVESLDWQLSNGRNVDARIEIETKAICVECTTIEESKAARDRWNKHLEVARENSNQVFIESQDAYSPGRRLYAKVYDKIAPSYDLTRSQLSPDLPNILLVGLFPITSDLSPTSPSIGWALDELFAIQPTGNKSDVSLAEFLRRNSSNPSGSQEDLLAAPSCISGILLFAGCKLGQTRINYNARKEFRITHAEMAVFDKLFGQPPAYFL